MTCSVLSDVDVQRLINIRRHFHTARDFALAVEALDLETDCAEKARLLCRAFEYGRAHRGCQMGNNPFLDAMYIRGEYAVDQDGNNHLQDVFGEMARVVDDLYDWALARHLAEKQSWSGPSIELTQEPLPLPAALPASAEIVPWPVSTPYQAAA